MSITALAHDVSMPKFHAALAEVPPEAWKRWLENKDKYYAMCKKHINYAVAHYARQVPIPVADIEGQANLYFCVACLRWDPNGSASLPTYVASQLRLLSGYLVRPEARHKNQFSEVMTPQGPQDALSLIGKPDPDNTLEDYIAKLGPDAQLVYEKIVKGYYQRSQYASAQRPISAIALYRSKVLPWTSLSRYENALKGIQKAISMWAQGKDFRGYAQVV